MGYSFQTKFGTITINEDIVFNTIRKVAKSLSLYEIKEIKFEKSVNGIFTFYLYLNNNLSSVDYIDYINKFQDRLNKTIAASLNITNFFSVIILN